MPAVNLRLLHEIAHAALLRAGLRHSEADAWRLAGELGVPGAVARAFDPRVIAQVRALPIDWLSAWAEECRR